MNSSLNSVPYM